MYCELRKPDARLISVRVQIEPGKPVLVDLNALLQALELHPFPVLPTPPPRNASRARLDEFYREENTLVGFWSKHQWKAQGTLLGLAVKQGWCCADDPRDVNPNYFVPLDAVHSWLRSNAGTTFNFDEIHAEINDQLRKHVKACVAEIDAVKLQWEELLCSFSSPIQ